jgi:integrase
VRLLNQVDERRHPRTAATVGQLLERHLGELRVARKTLHTYQGYVDKHVMPYLGPLKVGQLDADALDSLYAELLRCRDHCDGTVGRVDHRTHRPHVCDARCTPHTCRPLAEWTVRKIHWILSGAFRRAQRWNWVATNPMTLAEPPAIRPPKPEAAHRRGGHTDHRGGLEGPRLGHAGLAHHGYGPAPWGVLRDPFGGISTL